MFLLILYQMKRLFITRLAVMPMLLLSAMLSSCDNDTDPSPGFVISFEQPGIFSLGEVRNIPYTLPGRPPLSIYAEDVPAGWTVEILQETREIKVTCSEDLPDGGKDGTAYIVLDPGGFMPRTPMAFQLTLTSR